ILLTGKNLPDSHHIGLKIHLGNFDPPTVALYISSVFGMDRAPDFLVEEMYRRTEGNPLLLTQLLHSLIQSHQIFDEQGRWSPTLLKEVGIDFGKLAIPKTLSEFCRNKFTALPPDYQKLVAMVSLAKAALNTSKVQQWGLELSKLEWKRLEKENLLSADPISGELKLLN